MNSTGINKSNPADLTDEEIISEVKNGNIDCFGEVVKRHNQKLYRVAVSYGVYDDDAEEVLQLAWISAFEKINQFRGESKFSTWLVRILINECLMLKRKKQKYTRINEENFVTIPSGDHQSPENKYMEKERKEMLEKAINQLPEKYRTVYMLKEVEGMSIDEASEALKISKVNVKVRLHRAKSILKKTLQNITDVSSLFTFGNERCDRVTDSVMNYIIKKKEEQVN